MGLLGGAFVEPNRRKSKRKVGRGHPASNRRGATLWIPPACRNEWIRREAGFYFRAGREVKARRRREVRLPGKEEEKKVIYLDQFPEALERKTGSENHWRPPHRFANKEVILDLTIDHSFPASLRHSPLPSFFYNIPTFPITKKKSRL